MAINPSIAKVGVAIVTNPASLPTAPTFTHGLTGGTPFQVDASTEVSSVSCGVRASVDTITNSVAAGADFESQAYADVLGLYAYAAMGAKSVSAGSATNTYVHTITMGSSLPQLEFFGQLDAEPVTSIDLAKVDQLSLEFGESQRILQMGVTLAGLAGHYGSTTWPGSAVSCFDGAFTCTGGTFVIGTGEEDAGTYYIKSGQLNLSNNLSTDYGANSTAPASINEGKLTASGQMVIVADSDAIYRIVHTGEDDGTDVTEGFYLGSFQWDFVHTKNSNYTLTITAANVPFTIDNPQADPSGTQVETTLSFADCLVASASGTPVSIVLTNGVASY